MPGIQLYGRVAATKVWVPLTCDANGKLVIDATAIFENPPTEDETKKGPSSEWAFDHKADAAAHHTKYTDAEARGSINDIFGSDGKADSDIDFGGFDLDNITEIYFNGGGTNTRACRLTYDDGLGRLYFWGKNEAGAFLNFSMYKWTGSAWKYYCSDDDVDNKIDTHAAISDAHHAKYTDAEAQAACNLDGTLYRSIAGIHFDAANPDTDQVSKNSGGYIQADADGITFMAQVDLPDGATVTGVIVYGNGAAAAETWQLTRVKMDDISSGAMASANINTEDSTITNPTIDNSTYAYFLVTTSLDTGDRIYGARISFTL